MKGEISNKVIVNNICEDLELRDSMVYLREMKIFKYGWIIEFKGENSDYVSFVNYFKKFGFF